MKQIGILLLIASGLMPLSYVLGQSIIDTNVFIQILIGLVLNIFIMRKLGLITKP